MNSGLNVLSLFDGISCGQIALERVGFKVNQYFASEIKKPAIKCTNYNYPNTIQLGDVRNIHYDKNCIIVHDGHSQTVFNTDTVHLFFSGSPCKGISRLNKNQTGLEHDESRLFYEAVRILREVQTDNPNVYFMFENTHGNREAVEIITETLGVNPISINSRLVSAQNRPRYYWTNIQYITQPTDKGITTKDVFDFSGEVADKHRVKWIESESGIKSIRMGYTRVNPYPKSGCLTASGHKKWNENYLLKDGVYYFLSQTELEKLQTLPIGYTSMLNYDEAYDCIGDGWTVDVIVHILKNIILK
jgi:DNA (cytosine-5)-methyltransferase 3A